VCSFLFFFFCFCCCCFFFAFSSRWISPKLRRSSWLGSRRGSSSFDLNGDFDLDEDDLDVDENEDDLDVDEDEDDVGVDEDDVDVDEDFFFFSLHLEHLHVLGSTSLPTIQRSHLHFSGSGASSSSTMGSG